MEKWKKLTFGIIIMATDVNLKNFGSGIIENINQLFKGTHKNKP